MGCFENHNKKTIDFNHYVFDWVFKSRRPALLDVPCRISISDIRFARTLGKMPVVKLEEFQELDRKSNNTKNKRILFNKFCSRK